MPAINGRKWRGGICAGLKTMNKSVGPCCQRGREIGRGGHLSVTLRLGLRVEKHFAEGELVGCIAGLLGQMGWVCLFHFFLF